MRDIYLSPKRFDYYSVIKQHAGLWPNMLFLPLLDKGKYCNKEIQSYNTTFMIIVTTTVWPLCIVYFLQKSFLKQTLSRCLYTGPWKASIVECVRIHAIDKWLNPLSHASIIYSIFHLLYMSCFTRAHLWQCQSQSVPAQPHTEGFQFASAKESTWHRSNHEWWNGWHMENVDVFTDSHCYCL